MKLKLRTYQLPVLLYRGKMLIVEFARQTGKSFTLANWAVKRMLEQLAKPDVQSWLIVVISNSRANGVEFGQKISDVLASVRDADLSITEGEAAAKQERQSEPLEVEDFFQRMEIRVDGKKGRILILAASPRTARGFSGDLILDEFAFHEHAERIWDAAEPIISANPEFVVRVASTHNGDGTLFNRWIREGKIPVASVKRSEAWHMGRGSRPHIEAFRERWHKIDRHACEAWWKSTGGAAQPQDRLVIASMHKRDEEGNPAEVTPEEREAEAGWERPVYRQNYENEPYHGDAQPFLSFEVIRQASVAPPFIVDEQSWSWQTLDMVARMAKAGSEIYIGQDFARSGDLSVVALLVDRSGTLEHFARLEMRDITSANQRREMERLLSVCRAVVGRVVVDFTGNGTGLSDELADRYGSLILPIHFSSTVPLDSTLKLAGDKRATMLIPERMALDMLRWMEDGKLHLPDDHILTADLRKPCRIQRGNRVLIAAARDNSDHADRFWALALALHGYVENIGSGGWDMQDIANSAVPEPEFAAASQFFAGWSAF